MRTEKSTIKSEAVFSDDGKHRVLLSREWDKSKPSAMVIMINPNSADTMICDTTTMLVINNLYKLGYGSMKIMNLYSMMTSKISFRFNADSDLNCAENDEYIKSVAKEVDVVILAWGSIGNNNTRIKERQKAVFEMLKPYSEKLKLISDAEGKKTFHPLAPQIRNSWNLIDFNYEEKENGTN